MNISQKLQIIKKFSQLTQENIARELGVSFATLNSWINGKSVPRANRQKLIDELYLKYTGQKIIPENVLQSKKEIIKSKSKKHKNVIRKITSNPDIYDQFILSLTYHTNGIEGSTLTENETAAILFQNVSLPNKSLTEHLEAKNHQSALRFLFEQVNPKFRITESFILRLHSILMNSIRPDAGAYRNHGVRIVGANVPTANHLKIPELMKEIIKNINKEKDDLIEHISAVHSKFEQIHPFSDGNGRIGRLLIGAMLIKKNLPPAVIRQEKKRLYCVYLNKSQVKKDNSSLQDFICDAVLEGFEILERK